MVAAVAFAYALLAYRERFQFGHLYRMIFLLGLASILLLPIVLAGQAAIAGYTCSVIMYQLVFLLIWVIAASAFRDRSAYAPGFFGLVYGFWSLGSFGGALFSSVFVQHLTMDNVHLIVFAAVLAVAVDYAVVFTEPTRTRSCRSCRSSTRRLQGEVPLGGADVPAFAARDGDRPAHRAGARFGAHREEAVPVAQHRADAPHAPLPEARHPQPPGAPRHHRAAEAVGASSAR